MRMNMVDACLSAVAPWCVDSRGRGAAARFYVGKSAAGYARGRTPRFKTAPSFIAELRNRGNRASVRCTRTHSCARARVMKPPRAVLRNLLPSDGSDGKFTGRAVVR